MIEVHPVSPAWSPDDDPAAVAVHDRIGWGLLLAAAVVLLVATLRNVSEPWEQGMRGSAAAEYSDGAVAHTLAHGLGVTLGMPAFILEVDGAIERRVNWHHPPLYWLYLAGPAWLFGHSPMVLRLAHLVLFLPGLFGLFLLVRRRIGPLSAGVAALLFATCPLVAYFGPMVLQDGAVLGLGLVTIWLFQRHIDAPSRASWLCTAGLFYVVTSLDYPGYWWGPAMFVLALGSMSRARAIVWVLSLFPVAVLAFATMALHYGMVLGGPWGFVRELLTVTRADHADARATVSWQWVGSAMRTLLLEHGNAPLVALAALGGSLALAVRTNVGRRLAWLGLALVVPGVLNYALMFVHALNHVFWSMQGFAGLCALASIVPIVGVRWCRGRGWPVRAAGAGLLLASSLTVVWGAYETHAVITRFEFVDNGTPAMMGKAMPHLGGCGHALTSAPGVPQVFFGPTQLWAGIDTADKLRICLSMAAQADLRGQIGFVVDASHRNTALTELLDGMAAPIVVDDILVYRLRL